MATLLRAIVSLANDTTIPRDAAQNTWHFWSEGVVADDCDDITDVLIAFYQSLATYMSGGLAATGHSITVYNLVDDPPRTPVATIPNFGLTLETTARLPNEVAVALSIEGDPLSGLPIGQRRGRIFLGPLNISTSGGKAGDLGVVDTFREDAATACGTVLTDLSSSNSTWAIFSPTRAGAPPWTALELANAAIFVTHGHIDDAYDTIRSRGGEPTERTNWP